MSRLARLSVLLVLATACSKSDSGPSCTAIVDNMLTLTKAMPGHGELEVANRKDMLDQCEKRNLTVDQRKCLATAKDLTGLAACTPRPASKL